MRSLWLWMCALVCAWKVGRGSVYARWFQEVLESGGEVVAHGVMGMLDLLRDPSAEGFAKVVEGEAF